MQETFIKHYANHLHSHYKPTRGTYKHLRRYLTGANMDLLKLGMDKVERLNCCYGLSSTSGGFSIGTITAPVNSKSDGLTLFHELGHAIDFIKGSKQDFYTKKLVLSCGFTLHNALKQELKGNLDFIYSYLEDGFNREILGVVPDDIIQPLLKLAPLDVRERKLRRVINSRNRVSNYVEIKAEYDDVVAQMKSIGDYFTYYKAFHKHPAYIEFQRDYGVIIDMLALYYPMRSMFAAHSMSYQNRDIGLEFFAEVYGLHVRNYNVALSHVKATFPKTYQCFLELMDYHRLNIS